MTGRTHDLAALTTLTFAVTYLTLPPITVGTALTSIAANLIGGAIPDIDQPAAKLWRRLPAGSIIGSIVRPFFGAHRSISHSILGVLVFGFLSYSALNYIRTFIIADMNVVWVSFMLGIISHLIMDAITKDGIPLFFPLTFRFGFPPIRKLRITTGTILESSLVFPGLLLLNAFLIYINYEKFWEFIRSIAR
jgi:inner membrane protein